MDPAATVPRLVAVARNSPIAESLIFVIFSVPHYTFLACVSSPGKAALRDSRIDDTEPSSDGL